MIRLLVPVGALAQGETLRVDDDEAHHLEVRRIGDGHEVEALDGAGARAVGAMQRNGKRWHLRVDSVVHHARPPELLLAVGGGDKDRFLWLAEKAAELGVTTLVPIETARSRHVENRLRQGTIEKARRRAREACKQSGNTWAPTVADVEPLDGLALRHPDLVWWLADAEGHPAPTGIGAAGIGWLIGPEGGFVVEDLTTLEREFAPVRVTLGVHVLRFETAAIAAAVLTADRRGT